MIDLLNKELNDALLKLDYVSGFSLNKTNNKKFGDYQFNGTFTLAKKYKKNPALIADEIKKELEKSSNYEKVEVLNNFINLTLSDEFLINYVNKLKDDKNLNIPEYKKEKIILDYGGANVAKELHVGHLRSANIGEALNRLLKAVGHETISDVHLGDWGRPMGLIIREIKDMYPDLSYFQTPYVQKDDFNITSKELNLIYPRASIKAENDKEYLEEAREITTKLQNGYKPYIDIWNKFKTISLKNIKNLYDLLNAQFDLWYGESDAHPYIEPLLEYLKENGYTEFDDGALIIDIKKEDDNKNFPPFILYKRDGGVLYTTTEIATMKMRMTEINPTKMIYLTDSRQNLHFESAFRTAYKTKIVPKEVELTHLGFGTINGSDKTPFKTRDGNVMGLLDLIELVRKETIKVIKDNIDDKETLSLKLAVAAIKYADLIPNISSDYVFDPVKFSDLSGKTGPYLLYTSVRMKSLLSKVDKVGKNYTKISSPEERNIILRLLDMKDILKRSADNYTLNELADYVYELSSDFNAFYNNNEVMSEEDQEKKDNWTFLINLTLETNLFNLNILGLDVPEEI